MAQHPDMDNPPNFTGLAIFNCPKCSSNLEPAYAQWYPTMYVLNEFGQVSTPGQEGVPAPAAPFMARTCKTCLFTWPERTADNPRPVL